MWSESQKRYSKSLKGLESRKKYQSSEKAKQTHKAYLLKRKAKLAEAKQPKETVQVNKKAVEGKIKVENPA